MKTKYFHLGLILIILSFSFVRCEIEKVKEKEYSIPETEYPLAKIYGYITDACTGKEVPGVLLSISADCGYLVSYWKTVSGAVTDSSGYFIFVNDYRGKSSGGLDRVEYCPNGNFYIIISPPEGFKEGGHGGLTTPNIRWSAGEHNVEIYPTGVLILNAVADSTLSNAEIEYIRVGMDLRINNKWYGLWLQTDPCQDFPCTFCYDNHCVFNDAWKNVMHYVHMRIRRNDSSYYFDSKEFFVGCNDTTYHKIYY